MRSFPGARRQIGLRMLRAPCEAETLNPKTLNPKLRYQNPGAACWAFAIAASHMKSKRMTDSIILETQNMGYNLTPYVQTQKASWYCRRLSCNTHAMQLPIGVTLGLYWGYIGVIWA